MVIVEVKPGVCQFLTRIQAQGDDAFQVSLQISSDCAHIQALAARLDTVSALIELRRSIVETTPYQLAAASRVHAACPVPSAIMKAIEVAAGMALPADVEVRIQRVSEPTLRQSS